MSKSVKIPLILISISGIIILILYHMFDFSEYLISEKPAVIESASDTTYQTEIQQIRRLEIDNSFWRQRIDMAQDKSIDLLVDLHRKEMSIEIGGVLVYTSNMYNYILNTNLKNVLYREDYLSWLKMPRTLENEWASIAKEPIQIRDIRPRSENESVLTHFRNPEAERESYIKLYFSGQLEIVLRQVDSVPDSLRATDIPVTKNEYVLEMFVSKTTANIIFRALVTGESSLALRPD